jgi:lysophospholipase L1-like esterase
LRLPVFAILVALIGCKHSSARLGAGLPLALNHYVAMGSSFAAGPGIGTSVVGASAQCARSNDNYAHQLARLRNLALTDVSCSGARTAHVLGPWDELPAQLDALRSDTRLVTITIGGNDLGYIGGLMGASCKALQLLEKSPARQCGPLMLPQENAFATLANQLRLIASKVHHRSPRARLIFVDYATVLPPSDVCANTPMAAEDAATARQIASRLVQITSQVAKESGADHLAASLVTREHHACAPDPWMNGFAPASVEASGVYYHPRLAGMTAVAEALDVMLGKR